MIKHSKARPAMTLDDVKSMTNVARQHIVNATIDLPQYASPMLRASSIDYAIESLQRVSALLHADAALHKARN